MGLDQPEIQTPPRLDPVRIIERRNTGSQPSTQKALEWISICTNHHARCSDGSLTLLPTRLIDVFKCSPDVALVDSKGQVGRYVCLSHCWGESKLIITKKSNLERHKDQISFSTLSKTFQDAVEFTRRLEIRYIWIDSLCILQE
jgi:uncharacterized Zn-finger protein